MLLHFPAQWEGAADHRLLGEGRQSAERDVLMELGEVRCLAEQSYIFSLCDARHCRAWLSCGR